MECPHYQEETAGAEPVKDETAVLTGLFQTLGGVSLITMLSSILTGTAIVFRWTDFFVPSVVLLVGPLVLLSVIVLFLVVVLPMRLNQVRNMLTRGAGLILLVYPLMTARYTAYFIFDMVLLAPALETVPFQWPVYSIAGILLLAEPSMKRMSILAYPRLAAEGMVFSLGLLTAVLTVFVTPEVVITGALYSITLLTASSVLVGLAVLYVIHPRFRGTEGAPLP